VCELGLNPHGSEIECSGGSEHDNEPAGSMKWGNFLTSILTLRLVRKNLVNILTESDTQVPKYAD
jgi:hypothetical protein